MDAFGIFLARAFSRPSVTRYLPEIRKIELSFNEKKGVSVLPYMRPFSENVPFPDFLAPLETFDLFNSYLVFRNPAFESVSSLERYQRLPKGTQTEKMLAEFYRILRAYYLICTHRDGHITEKPEQGIFVFDLPGENVVYSLHFVPIAFELLCSGVTYYLLSLRHPDPEAYVEAMLASYYKDAVDHIEFFCDEKGDIYQFRVPFAMNRQLRLIGGNADFRVEGENVIFDLEKKCRDVSRYPIDIYFQMDRKLYVVPVEALTDGKMPVAELPRWKAREDNDV